MYLIMITVAILNVYVSFKFSSNIPCFNHRGAAMLPRVSVTAFCDVCEIFNAFPPVG